MRALDSKCCLEPTHGSEKKTNVVLVLLLSMLLFLLLLLSLLLTMLLDVFVISLDRAQTKY